MINKNTQFDEAAAAMATMASGVAVAKADEPGALSWFGRAFLSGSEGILYGQSLNEPLSPYQQTVWTYRCISLIQMAVKGIPIRLARKTAARSFSKSYSPAIRRRKGNALHPISGTKGICVGSRQLAEGEEIDGGPAFDMLQRPNHYQDWPKFIEALVGFMLLRGRCAVIVSDDPDTELHVIDGRYIEPQFELDAQGLPLLMGYIYQPPKSGGRIPLAPSEVKYFNLWTDAGENPYAGMSPNLPARMAIATEYNASLYNASMLVNGGEPGMVVTLPGIMSDDQKAEFKAALNQRHQGAARAKRTLILQGGATAAPFGTSMNDLQFDQGKKTCRLEICAVWGVPPTVAGWVDAAGDSSAYTQNGPRQFYEQTIFPLLDGLLPAIQELVARRDVNAVVYFDVDDQPVVQAMRLARVDTMIKYASVGYPINAINAQLDLGMPDMPWGDTGFLDQGKLPAADVALGQVFPNIPEGPTPGEDPNNPQEPTDPASPNKPKARQTPQDGRTANAAWDIVACKSGSLERIWTAWAGSWNVLAKSFGREIARRLVVQERKVVTAIKREMPEVKAEGGRLKAEGTTNTKDSGIIGRILLSVFQDTADKTLWRARVMMFAKDAQELGLRQALADAGLAGDELEAAVKRIMANPQITAALMRETVRISGRIDDATRAILRHSLLAGMEDGETTLELANRIGDVMGTRRAAAISTARNTVGQVLSMGRHDGALASGMTHKKWIHSRGPGNRRPEHIAAERFYSANPIPIADYFEVGGARLMYPRDFDSGNMEQTMNCQCLQVYMRVRASIVDGLERAASGEFYSYETMMAARTNTAS